MRAFVFPGQGSQKVGMGADLAAASASAREVLEEVEKRMKRLDRQQRAAEADMYRWAMDQLARLRSA